MKFQYLRKVQHQNSLRNGEWRVHRLSSILTAPGSSPRGAFRGGAPQSEDCATKKLINSGLLKCKSRPETRKIVLSALEFVSKNCFLVIFVWTHTEFHETSRRFRDDDLFFWSSPQNSWTSDNFWDENQNLWTFLDWRPFFFCLHLLRLIHTLKFTYIKFSCPPKFIYAPPVTLSRRRAWTAQPRIHSEINEPLVPVKYWTQNIKCTAKCLLTFIEQRWELTQRINF